MVLKKAKDKVDKRDKKKNGDEVKEEEAENDKALEQRRFDAAEAKKKKARLVVRNLSFKASEAQVKEHFSAVGEVTEVKILVKPDGKRVGCGFVQFSSVPEAAEAIKKLNRSDLVGRTIAVDWAVAKGLYQKNEEVCSHFFLNVLLLDKLKC